METMSKIRVEFTESGDIIVPKIKPRYVRSSRCDMLEFKRSDYRLFDKAIDEVAKRLANVFNEMGKRDYKVHQPRESGPTGHEIYDNYSSRGTNVVEPNAIYMGYMWGVFQRYLAVYIDGKFLSGSVDLPDVLDLIKENFGEFKLRESKAECAKSVYRVYNKNAIDINFTRDTIEEIFEETGCNIRDFCIIFDGDHKKDRKKYEKSCKNRREQIIY